MKASVDNTTGVLIEASSCSTDATLTANANAQGFTNVKIVTLTDAEFMAMLTAKNALVGIG